MIIKSIWDVDIDCEVINNNSDKLVVVLPGIGYNLSKPYMRYSIKLALELGYDVLPIEFGFQAAGKGFDRKLVNNMVEESRKLLFGCIKKEYKEVVFIGKSIGTVVQNVICNGLDTKVRHIYLTPVDKTVELGIRNYSFVVTGTSDEFLSKKSLYTIKENKNAELIEVENANHSLDVEGNILKSIEILHDVLEKEKKYLLKE